MAFFANFGTNTIVSGILAHGGDSTVFILAFLAALILTPLVLRLALAAGGVDRPNVKRKRQCNAVPRFGGVAIYGAILIASALFGLSPIGELGVILFGGCVAVLGGVIDDVKNCRPAVKIVFQLLAAACGTTMSVSGGVTSGGVTAAGTLFLTVVLMNAYNLVDGLDGLCPLLSFTAILSLGIIQPSLAAALTLFAICGFVPYNYPGAKIYLGESGAAFLGFTVAQLTAARINSHGAIALFASAIPLAELIGTVIRRSLSQKSIFASDRGHMHHLMLDSGVNASFVAPIIFLVSLMFASVFLTV